MTEGMLPSDHHQDPKHKLKFAGSLILFLFLIQYSNNILLVIWNNNNSNNNGGEVVSSAAFASTLLKRKIRSTQIEERQQQQQAASAICRDYPTSFREFTKDIHDHPETKSLVEWRNSNNEKNWTFPQFDHSLLNDAFAGRRIAMIGDSTIFPMARWLHNLMKYVPKSHMDYMRTMSQQNLTETYLLTEEKLYQWSNFDTNFGPHVGPYDNGASLIYKGFNGSNIHLNCEFDDLIWPDIETFDPDIIVATWGIHMLHHPQTSACTIHQWLNYETFFLERVLRIALESTSKTRLLLFKTTNRLCRDHLQQEQIQKANDLVNKCILQQQQKRNRQKQQQQQQRLLLFGNSTQITTTEEEEEDAASSRIREICNQYQADRVCQKQVERMAQRNPMYNISTNDAIRYCRDATMTEAGSKLLNDRLYKWVKEKITQYNNNSSSSSSPNKQQQKQLTIGIFNDHDIESCNYTKPNDGKHYIILQLPRIRLLAHLTTCLWPG